MLLRKDHGGYVVEALAQKTNNCPRKKVFHVCHCISKDITQKKKLKMKVQSISNNEDFDVPKYCGLYLEKAKNELLYL